MRCFCRVSANRLDDVFEIIWEHIKRGGKALYVVYDPTEGYLKHVESNNIPHKRVSVTNEYGEQIDFLFVKVDKNYRKYGFVGLSMVECLLDDGEGDMDMGEIVEKYLGDDFKCLSLV